MNTILIYWLIASSSNFAATGSVQFGDGASCLAARSAIIRQWEGPAGADAVCVPAGPVVVTEPSVVTPSTPSIGGQPVAPIVINVPPPATPAVVAVAPKHYP